MFVNPERNQKVAKYSGLTLFRADIQVPGREPYVRVGALGSEPLAAHDLGKCGPEPTVTKVCHGPVGTGQQGKSEFSKCWPYERASQKVSK